jgi:dipeptidyl aminopeptidase/acylaminoacyl peptidase
VRRWCVFLAIGVLMACGVGCLPGADPGSQAPKQARAARLVLGSVEANQGWTLLRPVDPDTLADVQGLEALDLPPCSTGLKVQPGGALAVAVTGAIERPQRCGDAEGAALRVLDLNAWMWRPDIALAATSDAPLRLDGTTPAPIAWSADGRSVYALTTTPSEQRQLWLVDVAGGAQPVSIAINFVPARLDVAPNGSAVFVLGGQTAGNSRQGAAVSGSAFVAIYDAKTLVERLRVPLSGLSLGLPGAPTGSLSPGVAVAPDGSRYFVAHADRPVLDVVDTRAPRLERLERSLSLRDAPSFVGTREAWLGVSPDGSRLYAWRRAEMPADDLGMQLVDVRTWQVQTVDAVAERMGSSLDRRWLFQLDPPAYLRPGVPRPQQRGPRDQTGTRLSVLDATTRAPVAVLAGDQFPFSVGQYGVDRVYVTLVDRGPRGPDQAVVATVIGYDTASWREIARRSLDVPSALMGLSLPW